MALREQRAESTRRTLVDVALERFATQGYDETTTEEIAEAAGVSPRTFFRYFSTKESVLFFGEYDFLRSFTGVYVAQPPALSELDAARDAFLVLAPGLMPLQERIRLYQLAVDSSPQLRGREQAVEEQHLVTIADAVARRRGLQRADESCTLLAGVVMVTLRRAIDRWVTGPRRAEIGALITDEFEVLRNLLS